MHNFSNELNKLISQKKIKLKDMIEYLDYDHSTFFKIKRGEGLPATETMVRDIADFMQLTPTEYESLLTMYRIDKELPVNYK